MTDTGWHEPLFRARAGVWNRAMTTVTDSLTDLTVVVGAAPLRPEDVVAVARHGARVELDAAALARVAASRTLVEGLADDPEPHYGISTGFGALATTFIAPERRAQLQASLIRSHAAGTGAEVEREVVRALQLLRLQTLATGPHRRAPGRRRDVRRDAQRRHHPDRARVRLARAARATSRRSRTSRSPRWARATCATPRATCVRGGRRAGRGRHRAARAAREGGPRAHQRHRRHARDAAARPPRPVGAARHRRCRRGDVDRESARHRCRLRRRPHGAASAGRAGGIRGEPPRVPRRLADRRVAQATRQSARACRTRTRCAARRRCTAPRATPSTTPARSRSASCRRRSTTR